MALYGLLNIFFYEYNNHKLKHFVIPYIKIFYFYKTIAPNWQHKHERALWTSKHKEQKMSRKCWYNIQIQYKPEMYNGRGI
jgi:hypothetical protein